MAGIELTTFGLIGKRATNWAIARIYKAMWIGKTAWNIFQKIKPVYGVFKNFILELKINVINSTKKKVE